MDSMALACMIIGCILVGILLYGLFAAIFDNGPEYYALATVITRIDTENDIVTCEDFSGHIWQFEGIEDWQVGDNANLVIDTQGTPKIFDDIIIQATYGGWVLSR